MSFVFNLQIFQYRTIIFHQCLRPKLKHGYCVQTIFSVQPNNYKHHVNLEFFKLITFPILITIVKARQINTRIMNSCTR